MSKNTDWMDSMPAGNFGDDDEPKGMWWVRVCPRDGKRETAIKMWRLLEAMGATKDQVERINDHSFKVWVEDRATGQVWHDALVAAFGK